MCWSEEKMREIFSRSSSMIEYLFKVWAKENGEREREVYSSIW